MIETAPDFSNTTQFPESPMYLARFTRDSSWFFENINDIPSTVLRDHEVMHVKTPDIEVLGFSGHSPVLEGIILLNQSSVSHLPTVPVELFVARSANTTDITQLDVRLRRADGEPIVLQWIAPRERAQELQSVALLRNGDTMQLGGLNAADEPVALNYASPDNFTIGLGNLVGKRRGQITDILNAV